MKIRIFDSANMFKERGGVRQSLKNEKIIGMIAFLALGVLFVAFTTNCKSEKKAEKKDHASSDQFEYQAGRKLMTAEINAAIEGCLEAGAGEIVVSDSHGNAQNIIPDELNEAASSQAWS
jgi:hypothetical protein